MTEPDQPCVMISGNLVGLAPQMAGRCRRAAGVLAAGSSLDGVRLGHSFGPSRSIALHSFDCTAHGEQLVSHTI